MTTLPANEQRLLARVKRAGKAGVPAFRSVADCVNKDALVRADLIVWDVDRRRWFAAEHQPAPPRPTEADVTLNLTEYEAGVITGALVEYAQRWAIDEGAFATAHTLRNLIRDALPTAWTED